MRSRCWSRIRSRRLTVRPWCNVRVLEFVLSQTDRVWVDRIVSTHSGGKIVFIGGSKILGRYRGFWDRYGPVPFSGWLSVDCWARKCSANSIRPKPLDKNGALSMLGQELNKTWGGVAIKYNGEDLLLTFCSFPWGRINWTILSHFLRVQKQMNTINLTNGNLMILQKIYL